MADSILNYDFNSMIESPSLEDTTTAPAAKAPETGETPATTEPTQAAPIYEEDYETPEAVQDVLRNEWRDDFESKYQDASNAVQQFFKGDTETLQWLSQRIGNHPVAVKIALRLAAIYSGNGLPEKASPAATPTKELDAALADFQPNGKHYSDWLGGNEKLNQQRIELYRRRYPGKATIE